MPIVAVSFFADLNNESRFVHVGCWVRGSVCDRGQFGCEFGTMHGC